MGAILLLIAVVMALIKYWPQISEAAQTAWDKLTTGATAFWEGFKLLAKTAVNLVVGMINFMIRGVVTGINTIIGAINGIKFTVPSWIPVIGGKGVGFNIPTITAPQIPLLATGAVIPPNAAFAAVLGDQRTGRNIEAPEALIRQIIKEEIGNQGNREIKINFAGSLGALIRELKPYIDKENTRIGASLISGATA